MVVCRFFLQGYCKFGDRCRYQHFQDNRSPSPVSNYRGHNRSWHASNQGQPLGRAGSPVGHSQVPQVGSSSLNPLDLAEAIKTDVVAMEEGGQWPLSCYTPSKDFGAFPGFHDTSMEEVRYEAYQALSSGTFDQYVKKFENLIQATRMKWGMLKNPTGQAMNVIEKMASGQAVRAESPTNGLPLFSFTASFNSPQQQPPPPPSGFSLGGNSAFGAAQSSASVFSMGGTPHGPPPPVPSTSFTFTLAPQSTSGSPFESTAAAGHTNPTSSFGAPAFGQSGGLMFGSGTHVAPSNIQQPPPQPMSSGFFGAQANAENEGSVFGAAPIQTTGSSAFGCSAAAFGASAFFPSKTTGGGARPPCPSVCAGVYTPLADLTQSERNEFTAVTFTLGCVPLRPPPSELCV